jgi:hypothetical protein
MKAGTYKAVAKQWRQKVFESGTEAISVEYEVTEGPEAGQKIWWDGWLTEKAQERTCEALMVSGWTGADFARLPGLGSKPVELVVEDEVYNGQTRSRVKWVNEPGRAAKAADPAALAGYADRMQALAMGLKNKQNAKEQAAERANGGVKPMF